MQAAMKKLHVELARATGAAAISSTGTTHKGKVDMPVFWEENVEMWFRQVEGGFRR